jgi:hypothetical protein
MHGFLFLHVVDLRFVRDGGRLSGWELSGILNRLRYQFSFSGGPPPCQRHEAVNAREAIMKTSRRSLFCFFIILLAATLHAPLQAQDCTENRMQSRRLAKTATNDFYAAFLINNVFNYYGNNGDGSFNPYTPDCEGFEWPKGGGAGKTAAFEDGLIWACRQNGTLKANGSGYRHGLQAGKILPNGSADDPSLPKYRVYRVRPDVGPTTTWSAAMKQKIQSQEGDLIRRFQGQSLTDSALYVQYIKDWNEWPASDGAPYTDVNGNGVYDPSVDIPGVAGADQTLWHVSNDLDTKRANDVGGVTPIGLEVQRTIWGYNRTGVLGNTIFTKYRMVNKSAVRLDSMYVGQWADPDLGGAVSGIVYDTPGCDSTLNLGYVYSGKEVYGGWGSPPPAFGYVLVQGPLVPGSSSDSAITSSGFRKGYRNLPMTSYIFTVCGNSTYVDARNGSSTDWYNVLRGVGTRTGTPFIDPSTGSITKYLASGDPVAGKGWIGASGDCTATLSSGPFTLAAGDTQEVVVAATIAMGADRINSVAVLKSAAAQLRSSYRGTSQLLVSIPQPVAPTSFSLNQNYPNPFNPTTNIEFRLPAGQAGMVNRELVTLRIFNVLGREVATLVNDMRPPGVYTVRWDASAFASGVYFYRLQAGGLTESKAMVLMK